MGRLWAELLAAAPADFVPAALAFSAAALIGFGAYKLRRRLHQAHEELGLHEQRLRLFMDSVTDVAIYMLDSEGRVIHWDRGSERLMRYGAEEVIGRHFSLFYTEDEQRNRVPQDALGVAAATGRFDADHWVVRKDRSGFWASGIIQPVTDAGGKLIGFASIVRDCTDRWVEQHDLRQAKEQAEASATMAEQLLAELQGANHDLVEANDRLQKFTSIVAHDLRAPLRRVEAFTGLLQEHYATAMDEDGQDIMARIERGVARIRLMLASLLDYSKCSREGLKGKTAVLGQVIEAAIEDLGVEPSVADIQIDLDGAREVAGDAQLIGHVIQNLIGNSLKFRREDCKPVIRIEAQLTALGEVQLAITDNGIGVEPEFADRVFDMFYRLHDEDEYAGVGIGLAVCRKIVGDHGGRIWIDKAYTGGTRVLMTLPAIEEAVAPEPRKQAA